MGAQAALPEANAKVNEQLAIIDSLLKPDSGLDNMVGRHPGRILKFIPGTDAANLDAKLDQITGATGVSAVESLKGVGRILGTEFTAGTEAQSRLGDRNQSPEAYRAALQEYRDKLTTQRDILHQKAYGLGSTVAPLAGGTVPTAPPAAAPGAPGAPAAPAAAPTAPAAGKAAEKAAIKTWKRNAQGKLELVQ
jgi:hypothetical protein